MATPFCDFKTLTGFGFMPIPESVATLSGIGIKPEDEWWREAPPLAS
jgi:hypothetical protein